MHHPHRPQDRIGLEERRRCVWRERRGMVYNELLKPRQTINTKRYKQQMNDLNRSLFEKGQKMAEPKETRQMQVTKSESQRIHKFR